MFQRKNGERANDELTEENLAGGKRSGLDGVHVGNRSRRARILDWGSGHASRTASTSSLDEGTRLRYVIVFLHRVSGRSRSYLTGNEAMTHTEASLYESY